MSAGSVNLGGQEYFLKTLNSCEVSCLHRENQGVCVLLSVDFRGSMSPGLHLRLETSACLLDLAIVCMWFPVVDSVVPVADKI